MGNRGSKEVTLELDGDKFIETGDGIKLSANMIHHMTLQNGGDGMNNQAPPEHGLKSSSNHVDMDMMRQQFQELLDEREKEIVRLKEKSIQDLENERAKNKEFHQLTLEECTKAAEEVKKAFKQPNFKPICENFQKQVVDCYKNNPGQSLKCSEYLKDFQVCVRNTNDSVFNRSRANGA